MSQSSRRYYYDDDSSSSQNLWIMVLFVAAAVGAFLFGRFVLGERLRGNAVAVRNAGVEQAATTTPEPATQPVPAPLPAAAATTPEPAAAANPGVSISTPEEEQARTQAEQSRPGGALDRAVAQAGKRDTGTDKPRDAERTRTRTERKAREDTSDEDHPAKKTKAKKDAERKQADAKKAKAKRHDDEDAPEAKPAKPERRPAKSKESGRTTSKPGAKPQPAPADMPDEEGGSKGKLHHVRAGSYDTQAAAEQHRKALQSKGVDAYIRSRTVGGKKVYEVQAGAYSSEKNARSKADELKKKGVDAELSDD